MLIKDDEFARTTIGQQVIFGMAEPHEVYLFSDMVDGKEPAYVVCGTVDDYCRINGVIKPWSKLLIDYKRRGKEKSDIYRMFGGLKKEMELVSYKDSIYAISRLTDDSFVMIGASIILFCNIKNDKIDCSGIGDKSVVEQLDCEALLAC